MYQKKHKPKSFFWHYFEEIDGHEVAIVRDKGRNGHYMSVTNDILRISGFIGADKILYSDSCGEWVFWSKKQGYCPIAKKIGEKYCPVSNLYVAKALVVMWLEGESGCPKER